MRLLFNTPFKPLDHPNLSGDVTIARDLHDFLKRRGHELKVCPNVNETELYLKPRTWPAVVRAQQQALRLVHEFRPHALVAYHTYYKIPDLIGPFLKRRGVPYFIFSGAYAEKRRRKLRTLPGYLLNKSALLASDHIFSNKGSDHECLSRLLPKDRHTYIRQGIRPDDFTFDPEARERLRSQWGAGERPVVVTAAVLRPGVKAEGVDFVIRACAELARRGHDPLLVVAGDGKGRAELEALATEVGPGSIRFLGLVDREKLREVFSAGDLFLFPGINEGLGMVYLEAQSCGLPVVATTHAGAKEVVRHEETGLLVEPFDLSVFADAAEKLLGDPALRASMSEAGKRFVREVHDIDANYARMEKIMLGIVGRQELGHSGPHD